MKLKFILFAGALAAASQVSAQVPAWIHDTVSTDAGYLKNVYYSLQNGEVAKVDADNWHIGFSADRFSASIIVNSADKGVQLYEVSTNIADFGTDLTSALSAAITNTPMPFYNSNLTWGIGAFNQNPSSNPFSYGWGDYDMASHWVIGSKIYGLITGNDTFQVLIVDKQTTPAATAPTYNFKIANIDGTGSITKSETIGGTASADRNFLYYNITTDAFINREPANADWDFVFSNYNDENVIFGNMQYKVFGVINNEGLEVAKVDTADIEFDNIVTNTQNYFYDTVNNSIGRAWKAAGPGGVTMTDSLCYFVIDMNGDVWQLVFTANNSGTASTDPGLVAFKKRNVTGLITAINEVGNDITKIGLFPNPAVNDVNIALEAKERVGAAQIIVTDMMGKTAYRGSVNVNKGLNAFNIPTANFANGNYMFTITNGNWKTTQKLVVQH